jgi:hypothetical protein
MSKSSNKLKEAVAKAYSEGWGDGASHINFAYKYPPHRVAWLLSQTRRDHYPLRTAQQYAEILAWENANYDGKKKIASTPETSPLEPTDTYKKRNRALEKKP